MRRQQNRKLIALTLDLPAFIKLETFATTALYRYNTQIMRQR